jgi:hypothetical protein
MKFSATVTILALLGIARTNAQSLLSNYFDAVGVNMRNLSDVPSSVPSSAPFHNANDSPSLSPSLGVSSGAPSDMPSMSPIVALPQPYVPNYDTIVADAQVVLAHCPCGSHKHCYTYHKEVIFLAELSSGILQADNQLQWSKIMDNAILRLCRKKLRQQKRLASPSPSASPSYSPSDVPSSAPSGAGVRRRQSLFWK